MRALYDSDVAHPRAAHSPYFPHVLRFFGYQFRKSSDELGYSERVEARTGVVKMSYHSSFAQSPGDSELRAQKQLDADASDYYRFSGDDWAPSKPLRNARLEQLPTDFQIVDAEKPHPYEFAEDDIRNAKSTAARLTALEKIASSGVESFKLKDKDGVEREFRVETQECGNKTLIHCYAKDSRGHEQIVMRAARNASGEIEQQRNKDGKPVSYYGDIWSRSMQGKTVLVGEKQEERPRVEKRTERNGDREREPKRDRNCDTDRERSRDREKGRERDSDKNRERESRRRDACEDSDAGRGPRIDIGRTLADVASIAAPFLMAQLSNRDRCNDRYSFRDYPNYLPERGCRNFYDGRNHHYSGGYRQDFDDYRRHDFHGYKRSVRCR